MTHIKYLFLFTMMLFCTFTFSIASTLSDNFEINNGGWANSTQRTAIGPPVNSTVLQIGSNNYAYKYYYFGPSVANTSVTITFNAYSGRAWGSKDYLRIYTYTNGAYTQSFYNTIPRTNGTADYVKKSFSFTATTDANGYVGFAIRTVHRGTNTSDALLDDVNITTVTTADPSFRAFSLRYQATFPGKMLTIGNTILVAPTTQTANICNTYKNGSYKLDTLNSNDQYYLCSYYADNSVTFPTTKAHLVVNPTQRRIRWVGLYWQALENNTTDLSTMQIKLRHSKMPPNKYLTITPTTLDKKQNIVPGYTSYAAFAELNATYFNDNNLTSGDITVGDIPVVEGKIPYIGTYGAWTLVYIYEDANEPLQNYSVYDGWQKVDLLNSQVDINITGFFTPKSSNNGINAQLSVFTAEGDKYIAGDKLNVKPSKNANFTTLLNNFNSSIQTTPSFIRTPSPTNNQGIDIHAFDLGTTGQNIILPKESSMLLRFSSARDTSYVNSFSQDAYFPSMIAFSAQLYTPKLCYDYAATIGDTISINYTTDRNITTNTYNKQPLKIRFLIRSMEADFNYENTKAHITFTGTTGSTLTHNPNYTEMSPPNDNAYYTYRNSLFGNHREIESNSSLGEVAMGSGVILPPNTGQADTNNGGVLLPNQSTYAILGYDTNDVNLSTRFDIHVNAQITFNPGDQPVDYHFLTSAPAGSNNRLNRCETNTTYNPVKYIVNMEHEGAANEPAETKYTLYTQVSNRPFNIELVSYKNPPLYQTPKTDFKDRFELELIDANAFLNNANAGYDTTCQNPQTLESYGFIKFNKKDNGRHTVQITSPKAYRNVAFRAWLITKIDSNNNRVLIVNDCKNAQDNTCFKKLYQDKIRDANHTKCDAYCGNRSTSGCYQCLKNHYATAVCSRDNFAIRPDAFSVAIYDDNNWDPAVTPTTSIATSNPNTTSGTNNQLKLASGYDYKIDINATQFGSNNASLNYYNSHFVYKKNLSTIPDKHNFWTDSVAVLEFKGNTAKCYDQTSSTIALQFRQNQLDPNYNHFRFENVSDYDMWLSDTQWTMVDRKEYPYKPKFNGKAVDDCDANSSSAIGKKVGCSIESNGVIHTRIYPYSFDMSDIKLSVLPADTNYTYFNDFSNPYYANALLQPIRTASTYYGLIKAQGKRNNIMSNFTAGCAATNVTLHAIIQPSRDTNSTSPLQQSLTLTSNTNQPTAFVVGNDQNITVPLSAFLDYNASASPRGFDGTNTRTIAPGEALIMLNTTFKKDVNNPENPLDVRYKKLNAYAPDSMSKADTNTHTPEGNSTNADNNITYYYAKVTPQRLLYPNVAKNFKLTPLYVDIFCDNATCANYNLTSPSQSPDESGPWYDASNIFDNTKDGTTDLTWNNAQANVNPNASILFNSAAATRNDINVSFTGQRPSTVTVTVKPVPWLLYDPINPNGYPSYQVEFNDAGWAGVGKTGDVVGTRSSSESKQRTNW